MKRRVNAARNAQEGVGGLQKCLKELDRLRKENASLLQETERLRKENEALKQRVEELEEERDSDSDSDSDSDGRPHGLFDDDDDESERYLKVIKDIVDEELEDMRNSMEMDLAYLAEEMVVSYEEDNRVANAIVLLKNNATRGEVEMHIEVDEQDEAAVMKALAANTSAKWVTFVGMSVKLLSKALATNRGMLELDVHCGFDEEIDAKGAALLGEALRTNTTLTALRVKMGSSDVGKGVATLARALRDNTTLVELTVIAERGLRKAEQQQVAEALATNTSLTILTVG